MEANGRLTGMTALVLVALLAAEGFTVLSIRRMLPAHVFIGLLLVPPLLLKLGSTGYRFVRYYVGDADYRRAGPPALAMRLLAPLVVVTTAALFVTGIVLWLPGLDAGGLWLRAHLVSFLAWFAVTAVHVLAYLERARRLGLADWQARGDVPGAITRRSLVAASLALGLLLALVSLPWAGAGPAPEG